MYFLISLGLAILVAVLWFFFRDRKALHLDILAIVFGAAAIMWFGDCIMSAAAGEAFISFDEVAEFDGWICLWTLGGGLFFWLILSFILNNKQKTVQA